MRRILIIGIGPGGAEYLTLQAIQAMNEADVFFVIDKGAEKNALMNFRKEICDRFIENKRYRMVEIPDAKRRADAGYEASVEAWHDERKALFEAAIARELGEDECGAFLVWGDPAIYDSTLRIVSQLSAQATVPVSFQVIPGISSIQVLAAKHRIPLNKIGRSIRVTTGRRLAEHVDFGDDNVVVMLDGDCAFQQVHAPQALIFWGAYLGTDDEILISGKLQDRAADIQRVRSDARRKHGWIMDTYILTNGDTRTAEES